MGAAWRQAIGEMAKIRFLRTADAMLPTAEFHTREFLTFTLVLVHVASLVLIAPIFGSQSVSFRVRALLAVALAMLVARWNWPRAPHCPRPWSITWCWPAQEGLIGLTLGLGVMVLFAGMQVAGQLISQMSGMQLAETLDPGADGSTPVISQLLYIVSLAVFVAIGGHRMIEALLDTFVWQPAGQGAFSRSIVEAATSLLA